ncbi:hypothetical protein JCM3774_001779 [Rhodotorula dairenensis]
MAPAASLGVASPVTAATSRSEPKPLIRASKEWVVPPRPKPGRKSAKADSDTRKPTAKTTQKAFRERRQEYVVELEEKVRQLEAGEGEKCVFYQQQAQKAKSEAVALQQENAQLRREVEALRAELARSHSHSHAPAAATGSSNRTSRARAAPVEFGETAASEAVPAKRRRVRAPSNASRGRSLGSESGSASPAAATPAAAAAVTSDSTAPLTHSPLSDDPHLSAPTSPRSGGDQPVATRVQIQIPRCTFCSTGPDCFCAQVGFDIAPTPAPTASSSSSSSSDADSHTTATKTGALYEAAARATDEDPYAAEATYEPAVPLRLRRRSPGTPKPKSVWTLDEPAAAAAVTGAARLIDAAKAVCSGDPSNCPACSDDPFGKAFCNALSSSVCSTQPCANCPSKNRSSRRIPTPPPEPPVVDEGMALLESLTDLPCCGDPVLCGSKVCKTENPEDVDVLARAPPPPPFWNSGKTGGIVETVPCNEAWSALKQHPNIAFADLQMLAEVVAKRTFCNGAVTETPPPPAGVVSETFPAHPGGGLNATKSAQASYYAAENTRRRLTVERGAVNEALGILDRAIGPSLHRV